MPKLKIIAEGGKMQPGPAVAQQLGPMGINLGKVISDVNEATAEFKGMNVPVELDVDAKTKEYTITVLSPAMSELIKKELGLEKASGESGKNWAGNIAFESVIKVAKQKQEGLLAKNLKAAVRLVVGTCHSAGILIDSKTPGEIQNEIRDGAYDNLINAGTTEVSAEKKKELDDFYKTLAAKQEQTKKALEAAKAEEEAKKTEAAAGAAPAEDKKEEDKKEDKKK